MEIISIKVKDGEVLVPTFGRKERFIYKVWGDGRYVTYAYTSTFGVGSCSSVAFTKEEFDGVEACTKEEWNETLRLSAEAHIKFVNEFVKEQSL